MSDISVLSKQFERLISLSNKFNESIIVQKKNRILKDGRYVKNYPNLELESSELDEANNYLEAFLKSLLDIIKRNAHSSDYIPSAIFDNYVKRINSITYIKDELVEVIRKLSANKKLNRDNIQLLDSLLSELDSEKNILYRKLRSGRE